MDNFGKKSKFNEDFEKEMDEDFKSTMKIFTPDNYLRWFVTILITWIIGFAVLCITFFVGSAVIAAVFKAVSEG